MQTPCTRPLGSTGVAVPRLILGTSSLGNLHRVRTLKEKRALVEGWLRAAESTGESGVVAVDTAGKYGAGLALEVLGEVLRELGVPPDRVLILNKLGWLRVPLRRAEPTFEPGAWLGLEHDAEQRISAAGVRECHEQGIRLLGASFAPQLVALHDPDEFLAAAPDAESRRRRLDQVLDALGSLVELRQKGDVRGVGVGAKDWRVVRELAAAFELDFVMLANSVTVYRQPRELMAWIEAQRQRKLGILNAAVFHGGFVVGGDHFDYRRLDERRPEDAARLRWRAAFQAECAAAGLSPAAVALRFGESVPGLDAVAVAVDTPAQAEELWRTRDLHIAPEFWQRLPVGETA